MKKDYERASMSAVVFVQEDIVTTSDPTVTDKSPIILPEDIF